MASRQHERTLWKILKTKLSEEQVLQKFNKLHKFSESCFPSDGNFPLTWFSSVIAQIDELWYHKLLVVSLTDTYGGLNLEIDKRISDDRIAGYVLEESPQKMTLLMNKHLFKNLFQKNEYGYHTGGLLCRDRLVCFLHVLLHESVHLILTMFDRTGFRPDIRDHGKDFNKIILNLFGQTDSQHGLIPGYEQYHDLQTIRKQIKKGMEVDIFVNDKWIPGVIQKKGYKWVNVKCDDSRFRVHTGLVRMKSPI